MRISHARTALAVATLILVGILSGCTGTPERLWLDAPDWSRATLVGATLVGDPVPMVLDENGNVYLLLIDGVEGRNYPRVISLDRTGATLWDRAYEEVAIARPDRPYMIWDGTQLQLFWLSNEQLYNAQVEATTGLLRDWPALLSGDAKVQDFSVALAPDGQMHVWFGGPRRTPGLYVLPPGNPDGDALLVDPEGVRPSIAFDDSGHLHAIWAHYPPGLPAFTVFYASYAQGVYQPGQATEVAQPRASATSIIDGPKLMLDQERVYVLWTIEVRTGTSAGLVDTRYVVFPWGQPQLISSPTVLTVPASYDLAYEDSPEGDLLAGSRVLLNPRPVESTGQVMHIATNQSIHQEQVIILRTLIPYLMRSSEMQVSTLYFREGLSHSYQLLSFTRGDSRSPNIVTDAEGFVYANWLERGDVPGFVIYFASTAPDYVEALSALTEGDIGRLTASTFFGLLTGAMLLPFALMWFIVPLILITVTSFIRREDEGLADWRVLLSLGLAILGYWISKVAFLPGMRDYVPFSAWIPIIPDWMQIPLKILTPLVIAMLGLFAAYWATYKRDRYSPLLFLLIYMVVDSILTMAIYGVIIFATN